MQHYKYQYTGAMAGNGNWWTRHLVREYLPVVQLSDLTQFARQQGWKLPQVGMA